MRNLAKIVLAAFVAVVCGGVCVACYSSKNVKADDRIVTKTQQVGYFCKVEAYGSADVKYVQGKKSGVRIVGAKSLVDNLVVEQKGETLVLTNKGNGLSFFTSSSDELTVYVTSPDLTDVTMKGSGDLDIEGNVDTDNLNVTLVGSGDADIHKIVCDNVKFDMRGSGDADIRSIDCSNVTFEVRGSGDLDAGSIDCKRAVCSVYGSGDVKLGNVGADNVAMLVQGSGDMSAVLRGVAQTSAKVLGSGDISVTFNNCNAADCEVRGSGDIVLRGSLGSLKQSVAGSGDISTSHLSLGRGYKEK